FVCREHGLDADRLVSIDRRIEPTLYALYRCQVRIFEWQPLRFRNAAREEIGIDNPDGSSKVLNVRLIVGRAFSRAIRAGENPENRPLIVYECQLKRPASVIFLGDQQHSSETRIQNRQRTSCYSRQRYEEP